MPSARSGKPAPGVDEGLASPGCLGGHAQGPGDLARPARTASTGLSGASSMSTVQPILQELVVAPLGTNDEGHARFAEKPHRRRIGVQTFHRGADLQMRMLDGVALAVVLFVLVRLLHHLGHEGKYNGRAGGDHASAGHRAEVFALSAS